MNDNYWSKQAINERLFKLDKQNSNNSTVILPNEKKVKVSMNRSLQEALGDFSTPIYFE